MTTGQLLKKLRLEHNMTLEQVGTLCSVARSNVMKWENGTVRNIDRSKLRILADYYGVSLVSLLTGEEEPEKLIPDEDIRMIARAGKKMTPEQRKESIRLLRYMFPEAFEGEAGESVSPVSAEENQSETID